MDFTQFDTAINKLPRCRVGFYPTPFHALPNLTAAYGINLFMKREDLAGPRACRQTSGPHQQGCECDGGLEGLGGLVVGHIAG
ncbi:hypothetical protein ABZX69_43460 [Streptomyces sp. NPDC004074]|uniref:hypothetical protein n=1 Tax=Streptomyces sp. NPDC004074 TaxID=3154277 RepID=UPI0033A40207